MGLLSKGYAPLRLIKEYTQFNSLKDLLVKNNSYKYKICPFTLLYGAINATESGYKPYNAIPTDYTSFTKVFDGKESIIVEWDNSVILTPDVTNNKWVKNLQVGTNMDGYLTDDSASIQFSSSSIDQSFQQEAVIRTFTFQVSELPTLQDDGTWVNVKRPINNDDLFKFYQILEVEDASPITDKILGDFNTTNLTNRQWFYITNVVNYYSPRKEYVYTSITFSSVNDKLAKTGYAIDQYIHIAGPGEGTAFPSLNEKKELVISDLLSKDLPITHMQIDFFGNNAPLTVVAFGRPANSNELNANGYTKSIIAPRHIFMQNFLAPIADPLKYNNTPSRNLVVLTGGANYFDINSNYKDWQTNLATAMYNNLQQKEFEGALGSDFTATTANLFDTIDPAKGKYQNAYWDDTWKVILQGKYPTNINPYFSHPKDSKTNINPTPEIDYAVLQNIDLKKLFFYNYFLNLYQEIVPKDARETTFFTFSSLPVVGGYLNEWTAGLPLGFRNVNNSLWPATPPLNVLMDGSLYWFVEKTLYNSTTNSGFVPVDLFRDDESNQLSGLLGSNATTISFCASLSDQILTGAYSTTDGSKVSSLGITTEQLAQSPLINGVPDTSKIMLLDYDTTIGDANPAGYLIDGIEFKTFGKVDYKITFYSGEPKPDNSNAVWMGYYTTYSKQTKNINNWTNRITLSNYLLAGKYRDSNTTFNYPKDIIMPVPPSEGIFNWNPDFNFSFNYGGSPIITMTGKENNKLLTAPNLDSKPTINLPPFLQNELNAGKVDTMQFTLSRIITGNGAYNKGSDDLIQTLSISGAYITSPVKIDPVIVGYPIDIGTNQKWQFTTSKDTSELTSELDFNPDLPSLLLVKDANTNLWYITLGNQVNWDATFKWSYQPQEDDFVNINNLNVSVTLNEVVVNYKA